MLFQSKINNTIKVHDLNYLDDEKMVNYFIWDFVIDDRFFPRESMEFYETNLSTLPIILQNDKTITRT